MLKVKVLVPNGKRVTVAFYRWHDITRPPPPRPYPSAAGDFVGFTTACAQKAVHLAFVRAESENGFTLYAIA